MPQYEHLHIFLFSFPGSTTNNFQEGYNRKFSHDSNLGAHPKCYKLCKYIKGELIEGGTEAKAVKQAPHSGAKRDMDKKYRVLKEKREKQMVKLHNKSISIKLFMSTVGALTFHGDTRYQAIGPTINQETFKVIETSTTLMDSLSDTFDTPFEDDTVQSVIEGSVLREKRRATHFTDCLKSNILTENQEAELLSKPMADESEEMTMDEGWQSAYRIMKEKNMELSKSQRDTPADGNCYVHSILDQLRYDPYMKIMSKMSVHDLRHMICNELDDVIEEDPNFFPLCVEIGKTNNPTDEAEGTEEGWKKRMKTNKVHCDEIFFRLTAECLKREVIFYLVGCGYKTRSYKPLVSAPDGVFHPMHLLYFSQVKFGVGHFQVRLNFFTLTILFLHL